MPGKVGETPRANPPSRPATSAREIAFIYKVRQHDTLAAIARKFSVSVADIKKWNGLKSDALNIDQMLLLKRVVKSLPSRGMPGSIKVCDVTATAYSLKGTTKDGSETHWGVVAADPKVFPLGTVLHVEGYGYAVVRDTGKKIIGNHIDIWMEKQDQAVHWGSRKIRVFVRSWGKG